MSQSRRMLIVLVAGLLVSGGGAFMIDRSSNQATADDTPILEVAQVPVTSTSSPTSSSVAAAGGRPARPVTPPRDEYAPEPIVEIGTMEIPKIGLRHVIYHGITMRNIDRGPSHWPGTAFPGETGNAVFAGHRVTRTAPFRNIDQLKPGDPVHFTVNGIRTTYLVTGSEVVTPKALHIVDPTPEPTATLFACHPPGSAKYRYVVRLALLAE
mgnify:CR=1 FL=1